MTPLIGISCCQKRFDDADVIAHAASDTYIRAVTEIVGGFPVLIPANGAQDDVDHLLARLDGVILTGSYSNVEPALYGGQPHPPDMLEDPHRDSITLPLIRSAIALGIPLLGICRGFQEMNVALGGSLHQRLQCVPGRIDHWSAMGPLPELRRSKAHRVTVLPDTWLHSVARAREIEVNSFHYQGVDRLAPGLIAEGLAPDGTIEAIRAVSGPGFAAGVQWHPEYDMETDPASHRIFTSFGAAASHYCRRQRPVLLYGT
jgi:putative glutamine amidotransferase